MKTTVRVATLLARRHAESSPSVAIFFENVVMNAVERAPSANRSRNMLGTRNAIRKASRFFPAPKRAAKSTSRMRPRTRLERMAMPTTPVARVLTRLFAGIAASFTDATEQCSGACAKRLNRSEPARPATPDWHRLQLSRRPQGDRLQKRIRTRWRRRWRRRRGGHRSLRGFWHEEA